ncbi:AraC family transcriptional regulator [Kibdelosporangium phytohabitans]|uniref:DNA-binding protein n=1 Tax=Kibdelosporangium phytohabitans TaxID=860235 RepID=A0A0N7F4N5_9PSEU|nr:helix-turn-helix domain-containing protein [Kibdelosporangium phytohabitans]ALG11927.1 DNA-binding protein [Kibdelosporangium phytohabitans]MBE1463381.1 AraC-like DNA-binding protein [Kibdelosporangium phytohabitans]
MDRSVDVPRFAVGAGYAVYQGPVWDSGTHRHAAFQIAIALRGEVAMVDAAAVEHRDVVLVVPPMVRHRILAAPDLLTFFVEPHCAFADRLRAGTRRHAAAGIVTAPGLKDLRENDIGMAPSTELDPRLVQAMTALADRSAPMPGVAAAVGLSPQRLRALARQQLGMPLTRWRVWARLRRAAEALRDGQSLVDAAVTAGFADQAHLTRQMREMMGITPAAVLPILRGQSRRAT